MAPPKLLLVVIYNDGVHHQAAERLKISRRFLMLQQMAVSASARVHLVAKPKSVCRNYLHGGSCRNKPRILESSAGAGPCRGL